MFKMIKELLESGKISEEVAKQLDDEVSNEMKKLRDEASNHRIAKQELEKTYQAKLDEQKKELEEQLEQAKQAGQAEIREQLESKLAQVSKERDDYAQKVVLATREATINSILANTDVADPELAKLYIEKHISIDGENTYISIDGERLTIENGAKKLFEQKPSLLKAQGSAGTGGQTPPNGTGGSKPISKEDFMMMSPVEQANHLKDNPNFLGE